MNSESTLTYDSTTDILYIMSASKHLLQAALELHCLNPKYYKKHFLKTPHKIATYSFWSTKDIYPTPMFCISSWRHSICQGNVFYFSFALEYFWLILWRYTDWDDEDVMLKPKALILQFT